MINVSMIASILGMPFFSRNLQRGYNSMEMIAAKLSGTNMTLAQCRNTNNKAAITI
jgi:hypothetical protein